MRVLVTGARGFVGRYLCDLLLARRHDVWGTFLEDDCADAALGLHLLKCDLRNFSDVRKAVQQVRPQQVYHLAALSSVRNSFDDPKSVYEANFWGALHLLEAVRALQPSARALLVGSAHEYGKVTRAKLPITEQHPLAPDTPYGVSKAAAGLLGNQFFQSYNINVIRARPFNHTGPGQSAHFVCSDFARQFAAIDLGRAQPIVHVGNVRMARDFSDVRDVVRAYELLLNKGVPGEAYNVGSGRAVPLSRILAILESFTSHEVRVNVEGKRVRSGESDVVYGSNRKLKKATGWRAEFALRTTLRDLYLYWKRNLEAEPRSLAEIVPSGINAPS
jgi:GDP-4-dehydro-6-deoxy-D-mannose reductase